MTPQEGHIWGPIIGIGVAVVVLAFRMRGIGPNAPPRPVRMITMWIVPALLVLVGASVMAVSSHLGVLDWLWVFAGLVAGAALGWQRGRMVAITVDPDTGRPMSKTSGAAFVFILVLFAARAGLRYLFEGQAGAWHINPMMVTDVFLAFAIGMLGMQRVEIFIRARRLVAQHAATGNIVS
jgi:NAD/NADP transhydrogenase beta subunit